MKAPPAPRPARRPRPEAYTEQDVCNYAHHLWIQSGMTFNGDPWAEARACLAAHLPPAEPCAAASVAPRPAAPPQERGPATIKELPGSGGPDNARGTASSARRDAASPG